MHILYLHQYFCPPGGWGNDRNLELAARWVASGCRVTIITTTALFPAGHPALYCKVWRGNVAGIEVIAVNEPYHQRMGFVRRIWAFLRIFWRIWMQSGWRDVRPDVVFAFSTPPTIGELGWQMARHYRVPFVFEIGDVWPDVPEAMGILKSRILLLALHRWVERLYHRASFISCLSEGIREQIATHDIPIMKLPVFHNGTNTDALRPEAQRAAQELVHILYTGSLGPANAPHLLLEALARLKSMQLPRWQCSIYGDGSELSRLQQLVEVLQLHDHVRFHSPVPKQQMQAVLAQGDIGVVTFAPVKALEANSANKFYDYLAVGLPVVLNYEGWQAGYLHQYKAGLSAPQGNTEAFAAQLATLIANAALRREMGQNARALAVARFDRNKLADDLLQRMREIIGQ